MCLFRKNNVQKKQPNVQKESSLGKDFFALLCEENQKTRQLGTNAFDDGNVETKTARKDSRQRLIDQSRKSIVSAYNGENIRDLSLQYRCSQKEIIQILKESIAENDKAVTTEG